MITWFVFGLLIVCLIVTYKFIKSYYDEKYQSEQYSFRKKRVLSKKIGFKDD